MGEGAAFCRDDLISLGLIPDRQISFPNIQAGNLNIRNNCSLTRVFFPLLVEEKRENLLKHEEEADSINSVEAGQRPHTRMNFQPGRNQKRCHNEHGRPASERVIEAVNLSPKKRSMIAGIGVHGPITRIGHQHAKTDSVDKESSGKHVSD